MKLTKGFTLIELLVVISLIGLLAGVGFVNYRSFASRQEIDNFIRILEGDMRKAQSEAANGRLLTGCVGPFQGYRVSFAATPQSGGAKATSYSLISACATTSVTSKTSQVPTTLTLRINRVPSSGVVNLLFKPLQKGTDVTSGNDLVLTVSSNNTAVTNTGTVTITATGEIR